MGYAHISLSATEKCSRCSGGGWVLDEAGDPAICPICMGFRYIEINPISKCEECDGVGWTSQIFQDFKKISLCWNNCQAYVHVNCPTCGDSNSISCPDCHGTGNDNECTKEDFDLVCCKRCGGSGNAYEPNPVKMSRKEWEGSELKKSIEGQFGKEWFFDMGENDRLILGELSYLQVVRCKRCINDESDHCFLCNGRRVVFFNYFEAHECKACRGLGKVEGPPACEGCGGSGKITCPSRFEMDKGFVCDLCDGKGNMIEIVSLRV